MTKRAASLVIGLWLLAVVTSASAEGAWVLWKVASKTDPKAPLVWKTYTFYSSQWDPVAAYDTSRACEEKKSTAESDESKALLRGERDKDRKGLITSYLFQCLADTVDPRGPKGK